MTITNVRPSREGRYFIMRCRTFLLLAVVLLPMSATAESTRLLRYPDTHDGLVAFVYSSDIWIVSSAGGVARRLTSHPGLELFPKFSPDGKWIAFTGQYDGDEQVYVIPTEGGKPTRLTDYPAWGPLAARWGSDNQVVGWTPDGNSVVFRSHRDQRAIVKSRLYSVSVSGGLPKPLPLMEAGSGAFSPDGTRILFSPQSRDFRTWKGYRGGWAHDLWILDEHGDARRVTNHNGSDRDPMWNALGINFVSDRSDRLNLYRADVNGKNVEQLTYHDKDVRWASDDMTGNVVYELHGDLRVYSVGGADNKIDIRVPDDGVHSRPHVANVGDQIEDFDLSPNGQRVALTARGDIFSVPIDKGVVRNLTRSDSHERLAAWSPDGSSIAFVSDATGEEELWLSRDEAVFHTRQITDGNKLRFYRIEWSPKGDRIAATDHRGQLFVININDGDLRKIGETGAWYRPDFEWSPDGKFLAFSALEPTFMTSLFVWGDAVGVHRLTPALNNEFNPVWHESGNYIYYLADRGYEPQIGAYEWNYVVARETVVQGIALRSGLPNPVGQEQAQIQNAELGDGIEFDDIESRVFRVPLDSDNYELLRLKGDELLLVRTAAFHLGKEPATDAELIAYSIESEEQRTLAKSILGETGSQDVTGTVGQVEVALESASVLVKDKNAGLVLYEIESAAPTPVDTSNVRKTVDPAKEWQNSFDEVWRRFRDFFYVRDMHGVDWPAIGQRYRELLPDVSHRSDLNYLIGEMVAELNVGHAYVFGGDSWSPSRPRSSLLGATFEFDPTANRYRIGHIYEGDNSDKLFRSPLTEVGQRASSGEYVLAIDGVDLTGKQNPYTLLREIGSDVVELVISPSPDYADSRALVVDTVRSEQPLIYFDWVEGNRKRVEELSAGKLGYLHIPDMGPTGIREFIRSYYGQIRKDGLIVDVRGNTGGNISQMILERLFRKPYSLGYVQGEKHARVYPWGVGGARVFSGEIAVLADETTLSDGEAFTWTFQAAGRGPVIGTRTWGGVVGIDETGRTVDGGGMRVPQFALADRDGQWVVEGVGVVPDIEVDNSPVDLIEGRDSQLDRAIVELLSMLDGREAGTLPESAPGPNKAVN